MAQYLTIARPYAKAVFEDALKGKLLEQWSDVLQALAAIVSDDRAEILIADPKLSEKQRKRLFFDLVQDVAPTSASALGKSLEHFIALLVDEKRLVALPDIAALYHQLLIKQQDVVEAEIISAFPVSEDHKKQIKEVLAKRFNSDIVLNVKKDDSLIGGAIVRAGNWVMDGSIKGKLTKLTDSLKSI